MKKSVVVTLSIIISLFFINFVLAESISEDLHLNIQTTNSTGGVTTGTFAFVFNVSTTSDCANVIYTNSTTLTTDQRGIISYYLPNVSLNYSEQYYLCYYRAGVLKDATKIARIPYAFRAKNVSISGIEPNSNLDIQTYNMTANYYFGNGSQLTDINIVETDSRWTANYTAFNESWSYTYNQTTNNSINNYISSNNLSVVNWITSFFVQISDIVNQVGNWSADKPNYYTITQVDTNISTANTSMKNYVDFQDNTYNTSNNNYISSNNASVVNWVTSTFVAISNLVNMVGNWSADKVNYYNITQVDTNISDANASVVNYIAVVNASMKNYVDTGDGRWNLNYTNMQTSCGSDFVTGVFENGTFMCGTVATFVEEDPYWTGNVTIFNSSWLNTYNSTVNDSINNYILSNNLSVENYVNEQNTSQTNYIIFVNTSMGNYVVYTNSTLVEILNNGSYLNYPWNATNESYMTGENFTLQNTSMQNYVDAQNTSQTNYIAVQNGSLVNYITIVNTSMKNYVDEQNNSQTNLINLNNASINSYISSNNASVTNWVTSTFVATANIVNMVGNWSDDRILYYTRAQVDTNISTANTSMKNYVNLQNNSQTNLINLNNASVNNYISSNNESVNNYILYVNSTNAAGSDAQTLDGYDSSFFMPLNTSVSGQFDFNGGWLANGLSIVNGNLYAQTGYFYNISSLSVSNLNINGSLLPYEGFDNQFDIGSPSLRWNDLYLGGNANVSGTLYVAGVNISANNESIVNWISNTYNTTRNNYVAYVNSTLVEILNNGSYFNYPWNATNTSYALFSDLNNGSYLNYPWNATNTSYALFSELNNGSYLNYPWNATNESYMTGDNFTLQNISMQNYIAVVNTSMKNYVDTQNTSQTNAMTAQNASQTNLINLNNASVNSYISSNNASVVNWANSVFVAISNLVNMVGNWSADKVNYYNTTQVNEVNTSMKNYVDEQNASQTNYIISANGTLVEILNNGSYFNSPWNATNTSYALFNDLNNGSYLNYPWNATNTSYMTGENFTLQNISMQNYIAVVNTSMNNTLNYYIPYIGANKNINFGNNNLTINGTTLFVDTNKSRIGIGTITPLSTLHLAGTLNATSNGGSLTVNSNGDIRIGI